MDTKVFIFGLDNAGKTALTAYVKEEKVLDDPKPTVKFNIEQMIIDDLNFVLWDAPGQLKYRERWSRGIEGSNALVFVLDTSDSDRFEEAKRVLDKILDDFAVRTLPVLFCFHKMDLDAAKQNLNKAREVMKLPLITDHKVEPVKTSIKTGEGIEELKNKLVDAVENVRWG